MTEYGRVNDWHPDPRDETSLCRAPHPEIGRHSTYSSFELYRLLDNSLLDIFRAKFVEGILVAFCEHKNFLGFCHAVNSHHGKRNRVCCETNMKILKEL